MIETSSSQASRLTTYAVMSAAAAAGVASQGFAAVQTSAAGWSGSASVTGRAATTDSLTAWGAGGTLLTNNNIAANLLVADTGPTSRNVGFAGGAVQFGQVGTGTATRLERGKRFSSGNVVDGNQGWASSVRLAQSYWFGGGGFFYSVNGTLGNGQEWGLGSGNATGSQSLRGFLAFRISDGGSDWYYGYFDVEVSRDDNGSGSALSLTVHGWAYNDVAGQSITIGGATAVPGGAGLSALAIGAAGLRGRRRGRN